MFFMHIYSIESWRWFKRNAKKMERVSSITPHIAWLVFLRGQIPRKGDEGSETIILKELSTLNLVTFPTYTACKRICNNLSCPYFFRTRRSPSPRSWSRRSRSKSPERRYTFSIRFQYSYCVANGCSVYLLSEVMYM